MLNLTNTEDFVSVSVYHDMDFPNNTCVDKAILPVLHYEVKKVEGVKIKQEDLKLD